MRDESLGPEEMDRALRKRFVSSEEYKGPPYFLLVSLDSDSCLPYSRPKALGSHDKYPPVPAIEARKTSLLVYICYRLLTAMTIRRNQAFYIKNLKPSINEGIKASKE